MKNPFDIGDIIRWVGPRSDRDPKLSSDYKVLQSKGELVTIEKYGTYMASSFVIWEKAKPFNKQDWL